MVHLTTHLAVLAVTVVFETVQFAVPTPEDVVLQQALIPKIFIGKHSESESTKKDVQLEATSGPADKTGRGSKLDSSQVFRLRPNDTEIEFCDLAFINEEDKNSAHAEFLSVNVSSDSPWTAGQLRPSSRMSSFVRSRPKRDTPRVRTIETAIFVDQYLNQRFHGRTADLKRLVLATMAEVQLIYKYSSMHTPIKIVLVKFEVLQGDNGPSNAGGDIDKYLDNFCSWQASKYRSADAATRWDHALMLTGLDLYKDSNGKRNKKVLGLAWVNGMCKPTYSCTLNEGKSFEAAFVIAHEMGHSLGILHDGRGNNCDTDKHIMSEKTGPGKVNWSPCSNRYLENFLTKGNGRCLDDSAKPTTDLDFQRVNRLPGEQYSPDIQCQLALGQQYKAYHSAKEPFNDICRELWCLSGSWATPAHPALEGSPCGKSGEKCHQGRCLSPNDRSAHAKRHTATGSQNSSTTANVNRRSIVNVGNLRNQAKDKNVRPQSRFPARQVRIGFGFGLANPNLGSRRSPNRASSTPANIGIGGPTLGHIPPIFLTTPAYVQGTPAPVRAVPRSRTISDQETRQTASSKSTLNISTDRPLFERVSGFFRSMLPEANRFFNIFAFGPQ